MVKNIIKRWFFSFSWILEFRFLFCFWENFFFTFFSFLDICNIHRKSMCWSLFLIKLKTWGHAFLSKKTPTQAFFQEYWEMFKKNVFMEHLRRLLLNWTLYAFSNDKLYLEPLKKSVNPRMHFDPPLSLFI